MINDIINYSILDFLRRYKSTDCQVLMNTDRHLSLTFNGIINTSILHYKNLNTMVYECLLPKICLVQLILKPDKCKYTIQLQMLNERTTIRFSDKLVLTEEEYFQYLVTSDFVFTHQHLKDINEMLKNLTTLENIRII